MAVFCSLFWYVYKWDILGLFFPTSEQDSDCSVCCQGETNTLPSSQRCTPIQCKRHRSVCYWQSAQALLRNKPCVIIIKYNTGCFVARLIFSISAPCLVLIQTEVAICRTLSDGILWHQGPGLHYHFFIIEKRNMRSSVYRGHNLHY